VSAGWYTRAEAAERFGVHVRTIDGGVADGSIPHRKVGRRVFMDGKWVDGEDHAPVNSNGGRTLYAGAGP
jgi:excisionase family DNA binding protein